ncbi:MAG: CPBP family intramembrane metalloprotease [Erysipelotrichaceae bacterium]|nr:CPBP family intramembrane metalloprotease [Erysipelotrichaceae bacterium]
METQSTLKSLKKPIIDHPMAYAFTSITLFYLFYFVTAILFVLFNLLYLGNSPEHLVKTHCFKAVSCIIFAAGTWIIAGRAKRRLEKHLQLNFKTRTFAGCLAALLFLLTVKGAAILISGMISPMNIAAFNEFLLSTVIFSIFDGVLEEILCRGIFVSNMMRFAASHKAGIYKAAVFSAAVSGFFHMLSLVVLGFTPAGIIEMTAFLCAGFLLGAVFIRTGSLTAVMIGHVAFDLMDVLIVKAQISHGIGTAQSLLSSQSLWITAAAVLLLIGSAAAGLYLLRPSKHGEIKKIWNLESKTPHFSQKFEKPVFVGQMMYY